MLGTEWKTLPNLFSCSAWASMAIPACTVGKVSLLQHPDWPPAFSLTSSHGLWVKSFCVSTSPLPSSYLASVSRLSPAIPCHHTTCFGYLECVLRVMPSCTPVSLSTCFPVGQRALCFSLVKACSFLKTQHRCLFLLNFLSIPLEELKAKTNPNFITVCVVLCGE